MLGRAVGAPIPKQRVRVTVAFACRSVEEGEELVWCYGQERRDADTYGRSAECDNEPVCLTVMEKIQTPDMATELLERVFSPRSGRGPLPYTACAAKDYTASDQAAPARARRRTHKTRADALRAQNGASARIRLGPAAIKLSAPKLAQILKSVSGNIVDQLKIEDPGDPTHPPFSGGDFVDKKEADGRSGVDVKAVDQLCDPRIWRTVRLTALSCGNVWKMRAIRASLVNADFKADLRLMRAPSARPHPLRRCAAMALMTRISG